MIAAGLDVGTSGVKGLALDVESGEVVASAERGYPFSTPRPGWSEQDPELWWGASESVLEELARAGELGGIGLSGPIGCCGLRSSGTISAPPRKPTRSRRASAGSRGSSRRRGTAR